METICLDFSAQICAEDLSVTAQVSMFTVPGNRRILWKNVRYSSLILYRSKLALDRVNVDKNVQDCRFLFDTKHSMFGCNFEENVKVKLCRRRRHISATWAYPVTHVRTVT